MESNHQGKVANKTDEANTFYNFFNLVVNPDFPISQNSYFRSFLCQGRDK